MSKTTSTVYLTVYDAEEIARIDPQARPGWWVSVADAVTFSRWSYLPLADDPGRDDVALDIGRMVLQYADNLIPERAEDRGST